MDRVLWIAYFGSINVDRLFWIVYFGSIIVVIVDRVLRTIIIMDPCIDYCGSRTLDRVLATDRGFWIGSDYKRGLGMRLRQGLKSAGVGSVWLKSHF